MWHVPQNFELRAPSASVPVGGPQPPPPPPPPPAQQSYAAEQPVWNVANATTAPDMSEIYPASNYPSKDTTINVMHLNQYTPQREMPQTRYDGVMPSGLFERSLQQHNIAQQPQYATAQQDNSYYIGAAAATLQNPKDPPRYRRYDTNVGLRALYAIGLLCLVLGIAGVGMLITYSTNGSHHSDPCDTECVILEGTRSCSGEGCCAETELSGVFYEEQCTSRSKKLLVAGIICVVVFGIALLTCAGYYIYREPEQQQQQQQQPHHQHFEAPPQHQDRNNQTFPHFAPSVVSPPRNNPTSPVRKVVSSEPDVYYIAKGGREGERDNNNPIIEDICGVYRKRMDLLWGCPVWETADGVCLLAATSRASWAISRRGDTVCESAPKTTHRLPCRLSEPSIWQARRESGTDWLPLSKLPIHEVFEEGTTVEAQLDDPSVCTSENPMRWVTCTVDRVVYATNGPEYFITVHVTSRYNNAEGQSGMSLQEAVPACMLRKMQNSPVRSSRDVLKTPPKKEPVFNVKNVFVRAEGQSNSEFTIAKNTEEADNLRCILTKLGLIPEDGETTEWTLVDAANDSPLRAVYEDLTEGGAYLAIKANSTNTTTLTAKRLDLSIVSEAAETKVLNPLQISSAPHSSHSVAAERLRARESRTKNIPESPSRKLAALRERMEERSVQALPSADLAGPGGVVVTQASVMVSISQSDAGVDHDQGDDFSEKDSYGADVGVAHSGYSTPPMLPMLPQRSASVDGRRLEIDSLQSRINSFSQRHSTPRKG